ncbi:MAG: TlpA disulfide reductase family protein [Bacteroidota bacterium]
MKKLLLSSIAFISFFSCNSESKSGVQIKGNLTNANGVTVYLEELSATSVIPKDSIKVNEKGEFTFNVAVNNPTFYRIKTAANNFCVLVIDSLEQIDFSADAKNIATTYKIKGSPNSEKLQEANKVITANYTKLDSLQAIFQGFQGNPYISMDSLDKVLGSQFDAIVASEADYIRNFVKENNTSLASLAVVEKLKPETDYASFKLLDESLTKKYANNSYVNAFHQRVVELGKLAIGSEAPEISLNNPKGELVKLSSLRGKVVMIDFWASWCRPCRMENPNVVKLYAAYKNKGFEIYGVSLDKDKAAWEKAIADDKLTWLHGSDLQFWSSPIAKSYDVQGIPMTYLIDKDGKIIAKGLRGKQLEDKLAEILK